MYNSWHVLKGLSRQHFSKVGFEIVLDLLLRVMPVSAALALPWLALFSVGLWV